MGQFLLDDILDNPAYAKLNRFGGVDYFGGAYGGGARFGPDGSFMTFLEPEFYGPDNSADP